MTATDVVTPVRSRRRARGVTTLTPASGLGLGIAVLWFSILALIPLIAVVVRGTDGGWSEFWGTLTNVQTAAAIRLTITEAFVVTLVDVVMGTIPFHLLMVVLLIALVIWPDIALWLPSKVIR